MVKRDDKLGARIGVAECNAAMVDRKENPDEHGIVHERHNDSMKVRIRRTEACTYSTLPVLLLNMVVLAGSRYRSCRISVFSMHTVCST
jgi:hypothetical protein